MQYQHLVFEEFARKVQPAVDVFLAPEGFDTTIDPAIVAEFAHVVYRFGHSMLLEDGRPARSQLPIEPIGLIEAFLNPLAFDNNGDLSPEEAAGAIVRGTTRQGGNEIDEFKTEALRNNLLGLPLDLAAINLARGRDTGIPSLNAARARILRNDLRQPAEAVHELGRLLAEPSKHPESLVNFIAAYGTHATIVDADVNTLNARSGGGDAARVRRSVTSDQCSRGGGDETHVRRHPTGPPRLLEQPDLRATPAASLGGLDNVDLWIGGLAERQMPFGGLLGSTFNFVFETQLENLQNADSFYYLSRTAGLQLPQRAREQLVCQAGDAQYGYDASAGRHLLNPGLHPRGRSDEAVHRSQRGGRRRHPGHCRRR